MASHRAIAVAIVTAVRIYRDSLAAALDAAPGIDVVSRAADWSEVFGRPLRPAPDVLLVDALQVSSSGGLRLLNRVAPEVRVVALSLAEKERTALACLEAGISAYVVRDASINDLTSTIERTAGGELLCSTRLAAALGRRVADLAAERTSGDHGTRLTLRELEVIHLIERHMSNREIATRLCIEVATVKNHVHNILAKLHVSRRSEAAEWARGPGAGLAVSASREVALGNGHPLAG